ncbi:hypothetical protein GAY96_12405 [Venatoribacter cucullus]|nr:hypothetical protein GAY96_12405 [Venatoribacter cucullus]
MLKTITTTRRGFMQLSASSAAVLTLGASIAGLTGCSKAPVASGYKVLRPGDIEILRALAPVILSGSYPGSLQDKAPDTLLHALDSLVLTLQDYARSQLVMMFDALQVAPVRLAMGAPWASWSEMPADDIEAFLHSWKTSRIQLKRMGYGSLCKLLTMCWYSQPATFALTGYPGMPQKIPAHS